MFKIKLTVPEGWRRETGATGCPRGFAPYTNCGTRFSDVDVGTPARETVIIPLAESWTGKAAALLDYAKRQKRQMDKYDAQLGEAMNAPTPNVRECERLEALSDKYYGAYWDASFLVAQLLRDNLHVDLPTARNMAFDRADDVQKIIKEVRA